MTYTNRQLSILAIPSCNGGALDRIAPCVCDVRNEWNVIFVCNQSCTLQNALHMCTHTPPPPPLYTLSIKDIGQGPENDAGAQY